MVDAAIPFFFVVSLLLAYVLAYLFLTAETVDFTWVVVRVYHSIPITRFFYALPEILYPQGLAGEPVFSMVVKKGDFALEVAKRWRNE